MDMTRRVFVFVLCSALMASAQGNTFDKVRYNGGTVSTKTKPDDWGNKLVVTSDAINFNLKDGQSISIPPKQVSSLSYGQEAHRRVGTMVALAILISPVALVGLMHKTRLHFIGIQYTAQDGKKAGLLMQGDKDNYRAILVALQSVTGAPVAVSEKEREFVPVGITTTVTKESEQATKTEDKSPNGSQETGTVSVTSTPEGAEVYSDGAFVGNAPASLKLAAGKHTIRVTAASYKEWSRDVTVTAGSEAKLTATLEKQN